MLLGVGGFAWWVELGREAGLLLDLGVMLSWRGFDFLEALKMIPLSMGCGFVNVRSGSMLVVC